MRRFTTPIHTFIIPEDIANEGISNIWVDYSQFGEVVVHREVDPATIAENQIVVKLTQAETGKFAAGADSQVLIQVRLKLTSGSALASNIIPSTVEDVLKEGEM